MKHFVPITAIVLAFVVHAASASARTVDATPPPTVSAAAANALEANPDDPKFCMGIQLKGLKYTGRCPIGSPVMPMIAVNQGFQRQVGVARLRGELRSGGLRSLDAQRVTRELRTVDQLNLGRARDRVYDYAKVQRRDKIKKLAGTCLLYGVVGAILGGVIGAIAPGMDWTVGTAVGAVNACINRLKDPKLEQWLKQHGLSAE